MRWGGGKSTACLWSPAPGSGLVLWCGAHGCSLLGCNTSTSTKKVCLASRLASGQTDPTEPGIPHRAARRTGQPSPTHGCPQPRAAPRKAPGQFRAEVPIPTVPYARVCREPDSHAAFLTHKAGAQQRGGKGRVNTLKDQGQRPKRSTQASLSLSCLSARQESQDQVLTAPSHTQDTLPRRQMGFIVDDSSWNKNISSTSCSLFTESH